MENFAYQIAACEFARFIACEANSPAAERVAQARMDGLKLAGPYECVSTATDKCITGGVLVTVVLDGHVYEFQL